MSQLEAERVARPQLLPSGPVAVATRPAAPTSPDSPRARPGDGDGGDARRHPNRYLPGLDGLRAISVGAVLLYHAGVSWLPGGFLGVEVFFVISGYLITTLLLAERRTKGSIGIRAFWMRRARRLLPALFLLLAIVALAAATIYREEAAELRSQLLAALTYSTNWFQILSEQSYFASVERPSPLLHLWSLAIEEQFYLVWPLVLAVLLRLFGGRRDGSRRSLWPAWIIGGGAVASVVLMAVLYEPGLDPSRIYYGTDTRAQALLFGALLGLLWAPAFGRAEQAKRSARGENLLGLVGLGGLILAFAGMHETDDLVYRGGLALVSILSMMAIVAAVNPATWLARVGLGNKLLAAIGKRSYGLYLWHWPIYVFTRPGLDLPLSQNETLVLRLVLTGIAAELSYRYVEVPIRTGAISRWLAALRSPNPARRAHRRKGVRTVVVGAALFLVPVTLSLVVATRPLGVVERTVLSGGAPSAPVVAAASQPSAGAAVTPPTATTLPPLPAPSNRNVTVIADSVLQSGRNTIMATLEAAGWQVEYRAKAAWMLYQAEESLRTTGTPVGATVVLGIGYNTLWARDRANFGAWAEMFDTQAEELLATLTSLGAERFVWVTLREPSKDVINEEGMDQYERYVWYFPYVNERLRLLRDRHKNVVLADWAAVSNHPDYTYDAIHLTSEGAALMANTIKPALGP
ncbi:MAG: acyltransferase family protein [Acidimicrobiales bacterium]